MFRQAAGVAALLLLATPLAAQTVPAPTAAEDDSVQALRSAYAVALPLHIMARARNAAPAINALAYQQAADDPRPLGLPLQNADLLHAVAWLDLGAGPVVLTLPALAGRYHSVAISTMATDLLTLLGTRSGSQGGRFALVPQGYDGALPDGATPIRLACRDCRLIARVLVKGPEDLEEARAALAGITLEAESQPTTAIGDTPVTPTATSLIATAAALAERNGGTLAQKAAPLATLDPAALQKALPALREEIAASLPASADTVNGWRYPRFPITDAAADDGYRAQVALSQPDALPRVEAMQMEARTDATGAALTGSKAYRLVLPYKMPIGGFWSVSMYQLDKAGVARFVSNPLNRFAVGDRSDHLRAERNGSTEIFIQARQPEGERVVNWLPAPAGPFTLVFRAYLPQSEMLDGSFRLPAPIADEPIP
ncbi:DUF1214 domain-containing protein [Polymorphobacter sp.]|uniref:DUF1214 domain-containing protein n=1 Tax=Polymorphobacter sp. TaxID=1909290 RepID=UPI003F708278